MMDTESPLTRLGFASPRVAFRKSRTRSRERLVSPRDGSLPLPLGEGGGERLRIIDRAYPLTLSLSPRERGPEATVVRLKRRAA